MVAELITKGGPKTGSPLMLLMVYPSDYTISAPTRPKIA